MNHRTDLLTREEIYKSVCEQYCDVIFTYHGKPCGLTCEVHDSVAYWQAWCGELIKEYEGGTSVAEVLADPFFDGKSIDELADTVEIDLL